MAAQDVVSKPSIATVKQAITQTLQENRGLLFMRPMLVGRVSYCGRDILTRNSDVAAYGDERGYVLVERWIVSKTLAGNEKQKPREGLSSLLLPCLPDAHVLFTEAVEVAEKELVGKREYYERWPLIKVLDIGGKPVVPQFQDGPGPAEVPPIPCHIHAGSVVNGKVIGPGKLEAYFFPPLDVAPYNRHLGRVISRLGFRPDTTREQVLAALQQFGISDHMYGLMNVFELHPQEGWTIPTGVVHAPGPWPTIEIQRAQDDFNFFCWQLGCTLHGPSREKMRQDLVLRGLKDESDLMMQALDWEKCVSPTFKQDNFRPVQVLSEGRWGRNTRIFWDLFYGEGFELRPGASWTRSAEERPYAVLLWAGCGTANGLPVSTQDVANPLYKNTSTEFLVTPGTALALQASADGPMLLYAFFPLLDP